MNTNFNACHYFLLLLFRIFLGKNNCIRVGFGRTAEDEYKDNLHKLSGTLIGQMGVLFTNKTKTDVLK